MNDDQWQAHVTPPGSLANPNSWTKAAGGKSRQRAAKAIGQWLEARGRLHQAIAALTMAELEAVAASAISRFVVLASQRIRDCPEDSEDLIRLLLG